MNKNRKTSHILNVFQFDANGHVILPATLTIGENPHSSDNTSKIPSTAWIRTYVTGLSYLTGNQSITVSGDATGSGTTAITLTLANTAVTPGTYGSTTLVPVVTVDSKGRITSVTTAAISGSLTFTGDVTGTGTTGTSTGLTLAASGVTAGTYTKVTVDSKGRVTVGANASTTDISEGTNLYYTDARVGTYLTANSYATQSYVGTQIANLVASAPATLDTLNELSVALGNDPNFATSVATSIGTKQAQLNGTGFVKVVGTTVSYDNNTYLTSFTETDPIYVASTWYSTTNNATNWNTAYGWGNHAIVGYLTSVPTHNQAWSTITSTPTTISGYGITNAYTDAQIQNFFNGANAITGYNKSNWDTAYGWGNHASGGYLTGITSSQVTTALGYTPYNSTNPSGYITGITSSNVTTALGYTPYNSTNPNGYITGITSGNVTTALGYTPYNSTNPSGYITGINSSAVTTALGFTPLSSSGSVTINGDLTVGVGNSSNIYMNDGDEGQRQIHCNSNRIGFLTQAGAWGAYCDDAGNWFANNLSGTNTGDQTNISGNAATAGGLAVHTDRNNEVNKIVRTDANGYIQAGWINTISGDNGTSALTRIYASDDAYLRFYTPANFRQVLDVPTRTGGSASGSWGISITGNAATFNNGSLYISTVNGNTLNSGFSNAGDSSDIWINYRGYNDAQSYFRDFRVGDGKGAQVALFTGSNKSLAITGAISASNLSGTNTGDQTNISGNAATASSVAWSGVSSGYRENYVLGFRPSDNSSSYAGFQFASPGNDSNAGYLLVRGGADNDVYTQNGLTIVADLGWLTLAQRTTASKGVRIMTGAATSVTRVTVTDATTTINNVLTASSNVDIDGSLRFQSSDDRRLYGASVGAGYNCVRVQGNWNTFDIMGRVIDWTGSNLHFGNGYNGVDHTGTYVILGNPISYFKVEGPIYASGDIIAYYSDRRLKQNIQPINSALDILNNIGAYTFEWNKKSEDVWAKKEGDKDFGLISQEVEAVWPLGVAIQGGKDINDKYDYGNPESKYYDPLHVEKNPEEYKTVRYDKMVTLAIAAIKEQQLQIEELKNKLDGLTS